MEQDTKHHILYVDDEESNLTVFKSSFRRYYHVHTASSAEEGLRILKKENIQVIITDQRMPHVTGIEFLKSIPPDLEFMSMILTAYTDVQAIIEAINLRFVYRYVTKPWNKNELKQNIDSAIDNLELKQINKQLVVELSRTNERLNLAIAGGSIGVWDWNIETNIISLDDRMLEIYDIPKQEIYYYKNWKEKIHPEDITKVEAVLKDVIDNHEKKSVEFRIILSNGAEKNIYASINTFRNSENSKSVVGINIDITERLNAEEKLKQKISELDKMNKFFVNRENRMIELKSEINDLLRKLGKKPKYDIPK